LLFALQDRPQRKPILLSERMDLSTAPRYIPPPSNHRRTIGFGIVVAFHALVIWAFMSGLGQMVVDRLKGPLETRIIEEAKRQGVYVAEDPQLLALLSKLDVGEEITQDMYTAVAVILSWVYWLKGMQPGDEKSTPVK